MDFVHEVHAAQTEYNCSTVDWMNCSSPIAYRCSGGREKRKKRKKKKGQPVNGKGHANEGIKV